MEKLALAIALLLASAGGYAAMQRLALGQQARLAGKATGLFPRPEHGWGEAVAALAGGSLYGLALAVSGRPVFSVLLVLALGAALVVVNRAKSAVLREPLVLADLWLLRQVVAYPHLYFPFLPVRKVMLGALGLVAVCVLTAISEAPAGGVVRLAAFCVFSVPLALLALLRLGRLPGLGRALLARCPVSHDSALDSERNGPLAAALVQPVQAGLLLRDGLARELATVGGALHRHWPGELAATMEKLVAGSRPNVILVQAESFCDVREKLPADLAHRLRDFLPNWDRLKALGRALPTPPGSFGAYTMRTEFTMLTGLDASALGPLGHNPFLLAARLPLWSLARLFREQGYLTLCAHPYHGDFFNRHRVYANLGFERLADIAYFADAPRFGPYVADEALATQVCAWVEESLRPVFAYLISMEAHGPWLPGRLSADELTAALGELADLPVTEELRYYLCHLRHMDRMAGMLMSLPNTEVFMFGDHPPALQWERSEG